MTNLEKAIQYLGWQGGTIHQVIEETGLSMNDILSSNNIIEDIKNNFKSDNYKLVVIIRDDSPMLQSNDVPKYRSVTINLTPKQQKQIKLKCVDKDFSGKNKYFETISQCFLEKTPL